MNRLLSFNPEPFESESEFVGAMQVPSFVGSRAGRACGCQHGPQLEAEGETAARPRRRALSRPSILGWAPAPLSAFDSQAFRQKIVRLAKQELARWGNGAIKETDPRTRRVLQDYWKTGAGVRYGEDQLGDPAFQNAHLWSAAFISWVMKTAGAGDTFKYSASHSVYTRAAKDNRIANSNNPFKAYRIAELASQVGDLICKSRAGSGATYDNIRPGMTTHCDIVTEVRPRTILAVGGNVRNSVAQKTVRTDPNGRITEPNYFAVIGIDGQQPSTPVIPFPTPPRPAAGSPPRSLRRPPGPVAPQGRQVHDRGAPNLRSVLFKDTPELTAVAQGHLRLGRKTDSPYPAPIRSTGRVVRKVQQALILLGYSLPRYGVDGNYGDETYQAVLAYKRKFNIRTGTGYLDGIVGPKTIVHLDANFPPGPLPACPVPTPPIVATAFAGRRNISFDIPGITCDPNVPVPVSLDPTRWAPILSAAMSANATLRVGNAVRTLIDGRETLEEMVSDVRATNGETDYIYLLAWDLTDNFQLIPGDPSTNVRQLMADASTRGVQIRAMLWAKPPLANLAEVQRINALPNGAAIRDDETVNKTPISRVRLGAALLAAGVAPELIPVILALLPPEDLARLGGAHHQKVLVVKRGETLVAYCGGIDINANRLNIVDVDSGQPHHDTHCRIVGPSAWDLLQTFIKRWRHHPDGAKIDSGPKGGLRGASEPVPGPIASPARIDAPFGGSTSVIIARTFTPTRKVPGIDPERDIKALLLAAIGNAKRFIYLEDQYLIDLDTAAALNRAIPKLQHLTILILGSPINRGMPFGREYRRDFVNRLTVGLSPTDAGKIGIFQLSTSQAKPVFGVHTYLHSKSWVFDDELAVIGSANCNRRGYQHDSEVDAFIFDDAPVRSNLTFAQQYRMRLWKEHLGVPARDVVDGVASAALWRTPSRPATARVMPFDHLLPRNPAQSVRDIAAEKLRFIIDPVP
jgi:phosphatidylserine/phosphatidylglycerophosphate/cardiolipin synthase-like enzyme